MRKALQLKKIDGDRIENRSRRSYYDRTPSEDFGRLKAEVKFGDG
jgi:hypothetical protein